MPPSSGVGFPWFAGKYQVPLRVLSSLTDPMVPVDEEMHSGTLITFEEDQKMEHAVVSGIAFSRDEAKFTLLSVPDKPGVAYSILGPVAAANIDVDMILQNQSVEGTTDFSFTVNRNDFQRTLDEQLGVAAEYFNRELEYKIKTFTTAFEPIMIIFVGLVVGFVAVSLVQAMYGVLGGVKEA